MITDRKHEVELNFLIVILVSAAASLGTLVVSIMLLGKATSMQSATARLLEDSKFIRQETCSLFSQLQAWQELAYVLDLKRPLPPMRGWAGSPDFLLRLAKELHQRKPVCVVECSSGVSTLVVARCLQQLGRGHAWSLEHEPEYAEKTRKMLEDFDLARWVTVIHAPLQTVHTATPWYQEENLPEQIGPIEVLVVDGPPRTVSSMARAPAFPRLRSRLAAGAVILVDDAARADESEMLRQWVQMEPALVIEPVYAEKGLALVHIPTCTP